MNAKKGLGCGCWPTLVILVLLLVPMAWAGYKGSQPMSMSEARGMTYWQFMAERAEKVRQTPIACQVSDGVLVIIGIPYFTTAYLWTGLYPQSAWNKILTVNPEYPRRPENLTWSQVPDEAWRLAEELSWGGLTANDITHSNCGLPTFTFPETSSH